MFPPLPLRNSPQPTDGFKTPEYDNCDYDYDDPLDTRSINLNVAHFVAGASVHCRQMMDHALSRLEEATEDIAELTDLLRHARLDDFQQEILRAHMSMWAQPDQWRLLSLRIVMGKLMAVAFPIILQSPHWKTRFKQLWGDMHTNVVADHIWLYKTGYCPHAPAITKGFQHMQIMWVKYRPDGWKLEDDFLFPEGKATKPGPHRNAKKKSKVVATHRADCAINQPQAVPRGGHHGRGRLDDSTGLVEPLARIHIGQSKTTSKKTDHNAKEAIAGTTDESRPLSAAEENTEAGLPQIHGPPPSAGKYPTTVANPRATATTPMVDRPMPVGFWPHAGLIRAVNPFVAQAPAAPTWAWPNGVQQQLYMANPPPFAPGFPPGSPSSFSASYPSSNRPSSSGQLSATAEPFMPGVAAVTDPSMGECSSSVTRLSSPVLGSPTPSRMSELYATYDGQHESACGELEDKTCSDGLDADTD